MMKTALGVLAAIVVVGGGYAWYASSKNETMDQDSAESMMKDDAMQKDDTTMKDDSMASSSDAMMKDESTTSMDAMNNSDTMKKGDGGAMSQ